MSWFEYGTPTKRSKRKGVCLKVSELPKPLILRAEMCMRSGEKIQWVTVKEIQNNNKVLLEFWCSGAVDYISLSDAWRYTVFHFSVDEDPAWVCEGDLGRGYKE